MLELETLSQRFEQFAWQECQSSPLYQQLALETSRDSDLLRLAAHGDHTPKPNLLLAAVHYLMLKGVEHPLTAYYPTLHGTATDTTKLFSTFRAFCLEHADQIRNLMIARRVQTNEVRRAAILLPVFTLIHQREGTNPLALVEVGTSAGLLLSLDKYGYDYEPGGRYGSRDSPVQIECSVRGDLRPPLSAELPPIAERIGIDLHPVDVRDPDEALWLRALVWGDQPERAQRLGQAMTIAVEDPPHLCAGDAVEVLPHVLSGIRAESIPCVFHCHTLNQFSEDARQRFEEVLMHGSVGRRLYRIALEIVAGDTYPHLTLSIFEDGQKIRQDQLAYYQSHGEWIEWLQPG